MWKKVVAFGIVSIIWCSGSSNAQTTCDVNNDGSVNVIDVQLVTNMALGAALCTVNIIGPGICTWDTQAVVIKSALGGGCHSVSLSWTASASANVVGYNVYRATAVSGPYTKQNTVPISGTTYVDTAAQPGQTYYYTATSVDGSNNESAQSSPIQAAVPSP